MAEASDKDIVSEARERFDRAKSFYSPQRILSVEDTRFAMGDSDNGWQWPDLISRDRVNNQRVMLTVNTTAQHCNQIINEIRQNRPACKVSPVDNGADKKTADILGGLIRNIQSESSADDAHDVAAEHSIYGGEGYWRIITEFESETSFRQVIRVKPLTNPCRVYIDPDARELDRSDAEWAFVFEDCNIKAFKREYPDIDPSSWIDDKRGWMDGDTFVRAEYYYTRYKADKLCLLADGKTAMKSQLPFGAIVTKERDTKVKTWNHCIIVGGHDQPLDKTVWPGQYMPIMTVVGKELNVNGEIVRKGIVRDLKDSARIVNYAYSETVQALALQNKIPYLAASEAIAGYENEWQNANVSNDAYLPFNAYDESGQQLPVPKHQEPAVLPAAQIQLLELSLSNMRGASGQQNANFGIKSEAQSGIGIQRLKVQGEIATFHFPDNLARALKYESKALLDLIPRVMTQEQVVRILGIDGTSEMATMDPNLPVAYHEMMTEEDVHKIFNPGIGIYDVSIDTGPSFQTQRQESAAILGELAKSDPTLMQRAGDIIVRSLDFQDADKLAERLEKMLPPGIANDKRGPQAQIAQLTQQLQQLQQESQQHIEEGLKLEEENAKLKAGEAATMAQTQQKVQAYAVDQQLARDKANADVQLKRDQIAADEAIKRAQAVADAQLAQDQADAQAALAKYKIDMDAKAKKYAADVARETDLAIAAENERIAAEKPEESEEKTITIKAPSGGTYTGTVKKSAISIKAPSGTYTGTIQ